MLTKSGEYECAIKVDAVEEPEVEILIKARLQLTKKRLFKYIQELQKKDKDERKEIYELIKSLDKSIDQDQSQVIKIRDKQIRKQLMDEIIEFKKDDVHGGRMNRSQADAIPFGQCIAMVAFSRP